ncbi:hypothetical protein QCA50_010863 [Cerrena zonata]|uniref:Uncharacterized protein n=1 Tax=Cerrena zonata TaxID=2478898 RepID=A0AAW0FZ71_9APHY
MGQFGSCPRTFACRNRPVSPDESFCIGSEDMEQQSTHTIKSQLVETPDSAISSDGNQISAIPRAQYELTTFPIRRTKPQKPRLRDQWHPPSPVIEEEAGETTTKEHQSLRSNSAGITSYRRRSSCTTVMSTYQYGRPRYITPSKPRPKTIRLCTPPRPPATPPWPTSIAPASMSYQTANIDLTWGENPIRRCDADTPLTITLTNDVLHALVDIISELDESFKPLDQAGSWFIQRFPDTPSADFYRYLELVAQKTNRAQRRASLAARHARALLEGFLEGRKFRHPNATNPFTTTNPMPGDYRSRIYYIGSANNRHDAAPMLRVRTLEPDDLSLPAYIPYSLRRVFIADEYGEQGMYHLSPPISKPDFLRDFQVRAQWQGHSVVIFPEHDGEQGDDFVTMGGEELGVDALGRDDDLGQDRHWEAPIEHFPRVPGDVTWQRWVYREYQHHWIVAQILGFIKVK